MVGSPLGLRVRCRLYYERPSSEIQILEELFLVVFGSRLAESSLDRSLLLLEFFVGAVAVAIIGAKSRCTAARSTAGALSSLAAIRVIALARSLAIATASLLIGGKIAALLALLSLLPLVLGILLC